MGDPIIVWPPDCGNFAPGDGSVCGGYTDCSDLAADSGFMSWTSVADGYVACCPA